MMKWKASELEKEQEKEQVTGCKRYQHAPCICLYSIPLRYHHLLTGLLLRWNSLVAQACAYERVTCTTTTKHLDI